MKKFNYMLLRRLITRNIARDMARVSLTERDEEKKCLIMNSIACVIIGYASIDIKRVRLFESVKDDNIKLWIYVENRECCDNNIVIDLGDCSESNLLMYYCDMPRLYDREGNLIMLDGTIEIDWDYVYQLGNEFDTPPSEYHNIQLIKSIDNLENITTERVGK